MDNVVVMFLDGKEVFFENANFYVDFSVNSIDIKTKDTNKIIAVFNFNNVAGVRTI